MARLIRILLLLLCPIVVLAQNRTIAGKVTRADTRAPLSHASVFLGNTSFGTTTADDGTFTINGIKPGQYTLIISSVGYEDNIRPIAVGTDAIKLDIELAQKNIQLKEVNITTLTKADRKLALERFKAEFIGNDENGRDCKLINPEVLNFSFHQNKNVLELYTNELFIVENQALGYRIKFLMKNYKSDAENGTLSYEGQRMFEELPGRESKQKNWRKKRDEAYYGSAMHFYRSLLKDSLESEGFTIYGLKRTLNPDTNIRILSRYINQSLTKGRLQRSNILRKTDQPGLYAITFPDYLYVTYNKRWEPTFFKNVYRPRYTLNYETTIISLLNRERLGLFDTNGIIIGDSPMYEGTWSKARLSTMLPVDYAPYGPAIDLTK